MIDATRPSGPTNERPTAGLAYMAQAAFWFAAMSLFVKLASATLPTMQIVFLRGCLTLLLSAALLWRAGIVPLGHRRGLLFVRGTLGSLALVCFYLAVGHLPLAEATVIHQTAPLFTAVAAAWLLRERLEPSVLLSIAVCLGGVLLIARPAWLWGDHPLAEPYAWGWAFVALLGSLLSSFAYVSVRRLGATEQPLVVVFYFPLVTVPTSAPFAVANWVWPTPRVWLYVLAIGTTTQIAQIALTKGLAREAAGRATAVGFLQVAFATAFGALVFGTLPDRWSFLGMALILGSLLASNRIWRR